MESIVEFALYTWVVVSILAVLVQLVRIVRYRRSNAAKQEAAADGAVSTQGARSPVSPSAIDLDGPGETSTPASTSPEPVSASAPAAGSSTAAQSTLSSPPPSTPAADRPDETPLPPPPARKAQTAPPAPPPTVSPATPPAQEVAASEPVPSEPAEGAATPTPSQPPEPDAPQPAETAVPPHSPDPTPSPDPAPTLADLLAGVRLPWNLLPTVDHSHQPSNDRVALLTNEGEPADVGADVADELERLGFSIAPRGEDTAIATRGDHVLGMRIIPDAVNVRIGDAPRFPSATATSIALDIWIES